MMWSVSPRGVYHEHHHAAPQSDRLQTHLAIGVAGIFAADHEPRENRFGSDKIETVIGDILETFGSSYK